MCFSTPADPEAAEGPPFRAMSSSSFSEMLASARTFRARDMVDEDAQGEDVQGTGRNVGVDEDRTFRARDVQGTGRGSGHGTSPRARDAQGTGRGSGHGTFRARDDVQGTGRKTTAKCWRRRGRSGRGTWWTRTFRAQRWRRRGRSGHGTYWSQRGRSVHALLMDADAHAEIRSWTRTLCWTRTRRTPRGAAVGGADAKELGLRMCSWKPSSHQIRSGAGAVTRRLLLVCTRDVPPIN